MKYSLVLLIWIAFFLTGFKEVYAKYEQAVLFVSSDCSECQNLKNKIEENNIRDSIEIYIYDLGEQEGQSKYQDIVYNTCQLEERTTPLLYINEECVTQKTRIDKILETLPEEISNYNRGKRNTEMLIIVIGVVLLLLIPLGKIIKKTKTAK